ncbi:hypothetical protein VTL71DRAFT_8490 [Oculimacula yallundae]|uniref:Uncharacterized protein n=1 Tax=Oculimacula yallundae TaxID=86028 RepID=A0ABR4CXW5_9HELO
MDAPRTVLITGCSDGSLGAALALAFHSSGWTVFASGRSLSKLATSRDAGIACIQLDVQSEESISNAMEDVKRRTGGSLDALVNNAGLGYSMSVTDTNLSELRKLFEVNVFSIISVTRSFLPLLLNSSSNSSWKPLIANNTSGMGLLGCGMPFQGGYSASKAAAASLTEAMRVELAPFGIRVINLVTGRVQSTFFQNSNVAELPSDSIFNIAKEAIEAPMNGHSSPSKREDAAVWAGHVVKDLTRSIPPLLVCRGTQAELGRIASFLPLGTLDRFFKSAAGLDVLEQKIQELKESGRLGSNR